MSETKKKFDAVAMMREARDEISAEIEGMTLEQELKWLASQELQDPLLRRLQDRAAQQSRRADASNEWRETQRMRVAPLTAIVRLPRNRQRGIRVGLREGA